MENLGAFMDKLDHMYVKDIPVPDIKPDQVLIQVEYVGICGSDVHYFHDGRCGTFVLGEGEFMLGHECAGTVVKAGEQVKTLVAGDRVCVEPGITCGKCEFCKSGHYNLCPDVEFLATPPVQGCYERYLAFPADLCFKLPDNVSSRAGCLIEPLATGMYAAELGAITVGDSVVILGCGCIGLMTLMSAKARGASQIIACDLENIRLEKAKELGADHVINSKETDILAEIARLTDGRGPDVVFETAGSKVTIAQTAYIVRRGGLIVLVGMSAEEEITYNFGQIMAKEVRIKSLFRYVNMFPKTIAAVAGGLIPVEKVATHEFTLDEIQKAFDSSIFDKSNVVKAVIKIN
nr:NAD(P)-dependent alcohol dehydrogenase [uncultured Eisenbergiella sp.]